MKKSFSFFLCSIIALSIALSACAQSSADHRLPGVEVVTSDMTPPLTIDMVSTAPSFEAVDDLITYSVDGAYPSHRVTAVANDVTLEFRNDQSSIDLSEWNLPAVFLEQIPLDESMKTLTYPFHKEYGEIQPSRQYVYLIPISRKDAKRMFKQLHLQTYSDTMARPPSKHYLVKL